MRLREATTAGISRLRRPEWAEPDCYAKLYVLPNGTIGPWGELWSRATQEAIQAPTPQTFPAWSLPADGWEVYTGPLDREDQP